MSIVEFIACIYCSVRTPRYRRWYFPFQGRLFSLEARHSRNQCSILPTAQSMVSENHCDCARACALQRRNHHTQPFRATHASFVQRKLTESWNGDRRNMPRPLRCPCNLSYVHSRAVVTRRMIAHNSHMNHQHNAAKIVNAHRMPPLLRADCHCPTLSPTGCGHDATRAGTAAWRFAPRAATCA
jgi:hypothetical protein